MLNTAYCVKRFPLSRRGVPSHFCLAKHKYLLMIAIYDRWEHSHKLYIECRFSVLTDLYFLIKDWDKSLIFYIEITSGGNSGIDAHGHLRMRGIADALTVFKKVIHSLLMQFFLKAIRILSLMNVACDILRKRYIVQQFWVKKWFSNILLR